MKKSPLCALFLVLLLLCGTSAAQAAANPFSIGTSNPQAAAVPAGVPESYLHAVKVLQENQYSENEIKSFVHQVFAMFDRHAEVNQLLLFFADQDLFMRVPEGRIDSAREFEKWYAGIGAKYRSNIHVVERIDVSIPAKGDYRVDLVVNWQALDREGKFSSLRFRQQWKIVDGGGYWPRIVSYTVDPVN